MRFPMLELPNPMNSTQGNRQVVERDTETHLLKVLREPQRRVPKQK